MKEEQIIIRDHRQPGWFRVDNEIITEYPHLSASAKVVYMALCRYADSKTQRSFPAIRTIAKNLSMNKDTVSRAMISLESSELIHRDIRKGKPTIYTMLRVRKIRTTKLVSPNSHKVSENRGSSVRKSGPEQYSNNNTHTKKGLKPVMGKDKDGHEYVLTDHQGRPQFE